MRKIPTLFVRDPEDRRRLSADVTPGCAWVLAGEGTPTRKYDGTCVKLDDAGRWWARRVVNAGRTPPPDFEAVQHDPVTGRGVGWEPIVQTGFRRWITEALDEAAARDLRLPAGTYELVGPKINGNPERTPGHVLVAHRDAAPVDLPARPTFDTLRDFFTTVLAPLGHEGIVWHHPDGRMVKLKVRDFTAR